MEVMTIDESVSVVVPVYNEVEVIEEVLRDIHEAVVSKHPRCEFIVAEDGSTDGTKEILRRLEAVSYTHLTLPTN